jgi:hypothetical protein
MATKEEIHKHAKLIVETHGGQMLFNLTEVHKIIGSGQNEVARRLHEAGILVKRQGPSKLVTAFDLAEYILANRVAPIDNVSR